MFTQNGALTNKTSGSACLDLFAIVGSARKHPAQVVQLFERAFRQDSALALRILLWARDARGGAGERQTFRHILHWLERRHPLIAFALIDSGIIQRIGRWDDLLGVASKGARRLVASQVGLALAGETGVAPNRLAAKWMPRRGPVAAWLCQELGVTQAQWRKALAAVSDTVEQKMAAGQWDRIVYRSVPSVAAARYQKAFARHDKKYAEYILDVQEGRDSMKAGVVFPHDVLKAARQHDAAATAQWSQLPRPAIAGNALVLCDVSGSMGVKISGATSAMDVSVALGLLLSEALEGPFKDKVLTFTSTPHFHTVTGSTLAERANCLMSAQWGMSTNLQAAFDAVLRMALTAEEGFVMPKALIVLSDMEFNQADRRGLTNHEAIRRKFAKAGFELPTVVYWNLNGRSKNLPVKGSNTGAVLVSGFSPKIAEVVLSGEFDKLNPELMMRAAVEVPRYDVKGLTSFAN